MGVGLETWSLSNQTVYPGSPWDQSQGAFYLALCQLKTVLAKPQIWTSSHLSLPPPPWPVSPHLNPLNIPFGIKPWDEKSPRDYCRKRQHLIKPGQKTLSEATVLPGSLEQLGVHSGKRQHHFISLHRFPTTHHQSPQRYMATCHKHFPQPARRCVRTTLRKSRH